VNVSVVEHNTSSTEYGAPFCKAEGASESSYGEFPEAGMWALRATLEPDTTISWSSDHGDEGVYVIDGAVEVAGDSLPAPVVCETETAIIIESGASVTVRALGRATIWHSGGCAPDPYIDGPLNRPFSAGHGVHIVPRSEAEEVVHRRPDGTETFSTFYADGVCRTCRIAFFKNGSNAAITGPSHTHSQNEVIHVTNGELQMGTVTVRAGSSVFVPADMRYSFRTPGPWEFLNFRRGIAYYVGHPREEPRLETWDGLAHL
jgi:quercetin dioxygenase-like cupin family protein